MDMPKPTEAHKRLEVLAGRWVGTETMHPSPWAPQGTSSEGVSDCRIALGGFAVIADYEQRNQGQVTFTGHGVYSYNAKDGRYELTWFDCMSGGREIFVGDFEGDVLTLTSQGPRGLSRTTSDYSEAGRVRTTMEMSQDGESWQPMMDADYRRQD